MSAHQIATDAPSASSFVEPTLGVDQVARVLGIGKRTLQKLIATGMAPPSFQVGRSRRWRSRDVSAWIDRQLAEASARDAVGVPAKCAQERGAQHSSR